MGNNTDYLIREYKRDMSQFDMLSFAEELEAAKNHDYDKLVVHNWRLVLSMATNYLNRGLEFADLIQEGNIGLIKAAQKFDYTKGFRFCTLATWWIRQSITRALDEQSHTIALPVYISENIKKVKRTEREMTAELERAPTMNELAARLGMTEAEVTNIYSYMFDPVSLDASVKDDDDESGDFGVFFEDTSIESPEYTCEKEDTRREVEMILDTLSERESKIMKMKYFYELTNEEVAKNLGVCAERVRQLEAKARRKMRNPIRAKMLKEAIL